MMQLAILALAAAYQWDLPPGFPAPKVPPDNPMSAAKVELGRHLFYDNRLSVNGAMSCSNCHRQELAFADDRARPIGATGEPLRRSAMSLVNVAYASVLNWNRPQVKTLEQQVLAPLLTGVPAELGMGGRTAELLRALRAGATYRRLFASAFPDVREPFTVQNVARAIASFERSIISARSPWDRYHYGGDRTAISEAAQRGEVLFFTDPAAACYRCHGGFAFTDSAGPAPFHNNGLYNLPGKFSYPELSLGLYESTRRLADVGKFKAPTLRNIALTAPYMHDGSLATLADVIDHYAAGGKRNPNQDRHVQPLHLTARNRLDLAEFLRALTDTGVTRDPRFRDPW